MLNRTLVYALLAEPYEPVVLTVTFVFATKFVPEGNVYVAAIALPLASVAAQLSRP